MLEDLLERGPMVAREMTGSGAAADSDMATPFTLDPNAHGQHVTERRVALAPLPTPRERQDGKMGAPDGMTLDRP